MAPRRSLSFILVALTACLLAAPSSSDAGVRVRIGTRPVLVVGTARPAQRVVIVKGVRMGTVDVNLKPKDSAVWVDGKYRGIAGQLDGSPDKLYLKPGRHRIKIVTPEGVVLKETLRIVAGQEIDLNLDLR